MGSNTEISYQSVSCRTMRDVHQSVVHYLQEPTCGPRRYKDEIFGEMVKLNVLLRKVKDLKPSSLTYALP